MIVHYNYVGDIVIPDWLASNVPQWGEQGDAIEDSRKDEVFAAELAKLDPNSVIKLLSEYDLDLGDADGNLTKLVWIIVGDVHEGMWDDEDQDLILTD